MLFLYGPLVGGPPVFGPWSSKTDETACLRVLVRHSNRPMIRADTGSLRLCEKLTVQQPVLMGFTCSFSCGNIPQNRRVTSTGYKSAFLEIANLHNSFN